jgi:hypothetical protein
MTADPRLPGPGSLSFSGSSRYLDARPDFEESQPRIYVKFRPEGAKIPQVALLDTGAHYCILDRDLASVVGPHLTESLGKFAVRTAYGLVQGDLYTHRITLLADIGESLDVEMTLFIPPDWPGPNFLGYMGAMDRVRFAIDPQVSEFYIASFS